MEAEFGGVSAGGLGIPVFDVTQSGGGPSAFVASQSGGKAGGVTLSKFSLSVRRLQHGGHLPRCCANSKPTAMTADMSRIKQVIFRDALAVNVRFRFTIIDRLSL